MAYQTPLTIAEVVAGIASRKYLLPSIQREFVWSQKQIETLFDSLMRDYPINTFLFWEVPAEKVQEGIDFIKDCMEAKPYEGFDVPLIAETTAGEDFGSLEE